MRDRRQHGQASVELVAILPLLAVIVFAAFAFLAAGSARETASAAAQAGAMALLQDADPKQAAKEVLQAAEAPPSTVTVAGSRVRVTVRPRGLGPASGLLVATSTAESGDGVPAADRSTTAVRGGDGRGSR